MQAAVYEGPFTITVKERPKPIIKDDGDAILKVQLAGLCGSDLHAYRGHQKTTTGHIMGHEFLGVIETVGPAVHKFKVGQKVMSIFSPMCMKCWFCKHGYTNRCQNGPSFGSMALDGGQAEYVRIPFADSTLETIPDNVDDDLMMLMCDIFPTGYYGTMKALTKLMQNTETAENILNFKPLQSAPQLSYTRQQLKDVTIVCLGCGPVGICGVLTAIALGAGTVYAVDSVPDRLEQARNMGAIPLTLGDDEILSIIKTATDGRGADAVVENVGNRAAMRLAFDLVRPCGVISSIGFHQSDLPFDAFEAYSKNIDLNMGRAAVRPVFGEALRILIEHQDKLSSFISHKMPLTEAAKAYDMFEKHQARKVLFTL